ncbi:poly(3-hydroxybutyrate) depolymerase [Dyadobacter luteus]|uniref:Poly(3-hydroxybutyrate) depolymerase n=1 Tax=Dyadobacter luteus TaxID=2259619 RepID=A0A3D8Y3I8_9BACT|nr:PHB depolymerase family esterase [Dyadobacter luteus]REA56629.1 poly(3-hydroxybutyrate) depolymerase [Dyadobacter luteus]
MLKKLCLASLLLTAAPSIAQPVADSILVGNHYRVFYFNKPQTNRTNGSLMFAIHGSGGNAANFMKNAQQLEKRAESENFIVVYPQGYKSFWNECRKHSEAEANKIDIDEQAFFQGMINYFGDKYAINKRNVFASGFSGGGQMAYKMGITMPETFKAICAMVANMPTAENMDCIESKKPIATMIINGTADPVNPYEGGEMKSAGLTLGNVQSTDQSFNYWARLAGYKGKPDKQLVPDPDKTNNITIEKYTFKEKRKPEVTLLKVNNGKHEFQSDMDFFSAAWDFFKRQI